MGPTMIHIVCLPAYLISTAQTPHPQGDALINLCTATKTKPHTLVINLQVAIQSQTHRHKQQKRQKTKAKKTTTKQQK